MKRTTILTGQSIKYTIGNSPIVYTPRFICRAEDAPVTVSPEKQRVALATTVFLASAILLMATHIR